MKLDSITQAMGFGHRYDLIEEADDTKNEPQRKVIQVATTSWPKFLLCNLLAASAGAGVMYLLTRGTTTTQPATAAAAAAASSSPTASAVALSTSSASRVAPTASIEYVEAAAAFPNELDGIILDCGYSAEEARAKGCVYDVMMQDWVPEPCYDSVLTERYLAEGNYTWYADGQGETTMTDEQMRKGDHSHAWMATSYHKAHCVFSWMKIIRALRNNWAISQELLSYDHVMHCAHGALKQSSEDQGLGVSAPTNYPRCALYGTWRKALIPDKHDSTQR